MAPLLSIPSFLCLLIILSKFIPHLAANYTPPLTFVLGDSTVDVGTNKHLTLSDVRADFPHNGIDFPRSRPTGRFSNAKRFGLKRSPPPFCFCVRLNFIVSDSICIKRVVPLSEQIAQFITVCNNFTAMNGSAATEAMLSKALFFISIGSNDSFSYFANQTMLQTMPKQEFISNLVSTYSTHITTLYKVGAGRFSIIGVPPVGCCPSQRLVQKNITGQDGCFDLMNDYAQTFHLALDELLSNITSQLPGIKYSLGNLFNTTLDAIANPGFFKFNNVKEACCGHGDLNAQGPCNQTASLCPDRHKYLYWERFHSTKKAADLAAEKLYSGATYFASPINFSQLPYDN